MGDGLRGIELGVGAESIGRDLDGLLVLGRVGAEGVLHAVAELAEDVFRDVSGVLGDEIDTDALTADKADDLLNLLDEGLGGVGKEHVGFVEEENESWQLHVAYLGQLGVEVAEQPEQEGTVELGIEHQLVGGEDAHDAATPFVGEEVEDVERGLGKEDVTALILKAEESALNGADAGRRHHAVLGGVLAMVLADVVEHRAEVLDVDEQQAAVVGNAEDDVEYAGLRLVEVEQTSQQLGTHVADSGAHGVSLLAEDVVEAYRAAFELRILDAELGAAFLNEGTHGAGTANAA